LRRGTARIKLAPSWEGMAAGEIRATTLVMVGDEGIVVAVIVFLLGLLQGKP
jgi:hypothetical protein